MAFRRYDHHDTVAMLTLKLPIGDQSWFFHFELLTKLHFLTSAVKNYWLFWLYRGFFTIFYCGEYSSLFMSIPKNITQYDGMGFYLGFSGIFCFKRMNKNQLFLWAWAVHGMKTQRDDISLSEVIWKIVVPQLIVTHTRPCFPIRELATWGRGWSPQWWLLGFATGIFDA